MKVVEPSEECGSIRPRVQLRIAAPEQDAASGPPDILDELFEPVEVEGDTSPRTGSSPRRSEEDIVALPFTSSASVDEAPDEPPRPVRLAPDPRADSPLETPLAGRARDPGE